MHRIPLRIPRVAAVGRKRVEDRGDDAAGAAEAAQLLQLRGADDRSVRHVETDHGEVDPAREDALRGLGIDVAVELGGRGDVALADRAAHQDHASDALGRVGIPRQEQRHVRERPKRNERHRLVRGEQDPREEVDRVLVHRSTRRRRQPGDVAPHVGVDRARRPSEGELTHERPVGARSDGNLAGQELHDPQRVLRRLGHRLVPIDGRDPEHLHLGARQREHDRDHVVVAGVAVDQNRDRHQRFPPPVHFRRSSPPAQRGQPACHGIFCQNRAPVQRGAPRPKTPPSRPPPLRRRAPRGDWAAPRPRPTAPALPARATRIGKRNALSRSAGRYVRIARGQSTG